ncbi:MAG: DEAD/DEAH box helicase, partial [Actinobacteria bacterium]|nr:DEAD/DEAH box helicase [Actinomycetota bacterium]
PSISPSGADQWTLGPLGADDLALRALLIGTLPVTAHCLAVDPEEDRIQSPHEVVLALMGAVVDALPRTPGAAVAVDQVAWAAADVVDVSRLRPQLAGGDGAERVTVAIRVNPPIDEDSPFTCEVHVRSAADAQLHATAAAVWANHVEWADHSVQTDVLRTIRHAADRWAPLGRLLELPEPSGMAVSDSEALELLGAAASGLAMAGIEILVPAALTRSMRAHASVESGFDRSGPGIDLQAACELTWRATLDGEPVTDEELARLADAQRPLVKLRDEWVLVDSSILSKIGTRESLRAADALSAALSGLISFDGEFVEVDVAGPIADLAERVRSAAAPTDAPDPFGLHATLRPYQRRGVAWIDEMARLRLGGVLADDMGLGKTIQVLATLLRRLDDPDKTAIGPTLVVCPASVVTNWQREILRFAPSLRAVCYVGAERELPSLGPDDVVVTTYGLARRDVERLCAIDWQLVVADEAQHIKNPTSATARAMRRFTSGSRLAMTGTPVENRLSDLWALLDWTTPGLLGSLEAFRRRIAVPIERDRNPAVIEQFARLIAPFVLRRRKDDPEIVPELPPKTETVHPVLLTAEQAGLYRATTEALMSEIGTARGFARRGLVFKLLTALKQICNHPAQYLKQQGPIDGRSGKLEAFDELVDAIVDAGDSVLVFTQYVSMGNLLVQRLRERGISTQFLEGSTSLDKRAQMVDRFQDREFNVFVISLKAGGTGLNLTAATHVIHYDRWWNPAVENQASDRAWRIGQDRPVQIHQLVCEGTLEERIAELLEEKRSLAEAVVGSGEAWLAELNDDDLAELVSLGAES